eukprot:CAMPEP_0182553060 /NCGR_PEP_ID=MMETSP1323-20130603/49293_1 /TAXON_ID=236787 /ORGANISM="Florenciella parvula, Strain RCC1693" /LENGTH=767 /DNA_ID=CAMNT_0024764773 /DNA_START=15 /DNA_END=2318 /DNA_ORIENTATION=-
MIHWTPTCEDDVAAEAIERVVDELSKLDVDAPVNITDRLILDIKERERAGVTFKYGQEVKWKVQTLAKDEFDRYKPPFMISYATGTREDKDGPGCGVGMLYAHLIAKTLSDFGLDTFSRLHVPAGEVDWRTAYFDRVPEAKFMFVVVTQALYTSEDCLNEISAALSNGLKIVPLLFDSGVVYKNDQWETVIAKYEKQGDDKSLRRIEEIKKTRETFSKLNGEPAPPSTVLEIPAVLKVQAQRALEEVEARAQADLLKQIERQATEGVTIAKGQEVRNYFQSQIGGSVQEYWPEVIISYATGTRDDLDGEGCGPGMMYCHLPEVIISYATGTRDDLDGEGCGPGMMYCHLVVRHLTRAGIPCFTGLHVEGGYNWHLYFEKLRRAKIMIVIMSPAFFKSGPCFSEQLEARKNGLQVIPLLFQLDENGMPPGAEGGGAKWIEEYEKMNHDKRVAHDTLCAFRLRDDHDKGLKLNSEPAPPNTMLNSDLLGKLVKRVRRMLDGSDTGRRLPLSEAVERRASGGEQAHTTELANMAKQLQARTDELANMTKQCEESRARVALEGSVSAHQVELEEAHGKMAELEAKKEGELATLEKQLAEMAAELDVEKQAKTAETGELAEAIAELEAKKEGELAILEKQLASMAAELDAEKQAKAAEIQELTTALEGSVSAHQVELEEAHGKVAELEAKKEGELAILEKQLASMAAELDAEKQAKAAEIQELTTALEESVSAHQVELEEAHGKVAELEATATSPKKKRWFSLGPSKGKGAR